MHDTRKLCHGSQHWLLHAGEIRAAIVTQILLARATACDMTDWKARNGLVRKWPSAFEIASPGWHGTNRVG